MQHFEASSSINIHRSELKLCGKNRPAGFPPSVIFKLIIKALHLRGVNVKVRPEKSPLWKIKSLYQLNRISTAPHKLDLIVKHTHTDKQGKREQHVSRWSTPSVSYLSNNHIKWICSAPLLAEDFGG